tara:strand:+ start:1108 stop:1317 length:210 start_codon:yes stop_codon:yes gene_type:complete
MILKKAIGNVWFVVALLLRRITTNIRCVLGAIHRLCLIQKNYNILVYRVRQRLNKSNVPKYLYGKEKLK